MPNPLTPLQINKLEDSAAGRAIAAVNNAAGILHEFVDFTSDLVRNVFKTMIDSSIEQFEAYADLVAKVSGTVAEYEYKSLGGDTGAAALKYINEVVLPAFGAVASSNPVNPTLNAAPSSTPSNLTFTPATISFDPNKLADLDGSFANITATVA